MKKFIKLFIIAIIAIIVFSGILTSFAPKERESSVQTEALRDSILKSPENQEKIIKLKPLFNEEKDEFSDKAWVEPKSAPKYRNRNGVYAYFATENGRAFNFRFVYQYYSDEWLFIKNMIFNIDGENITITPDMETDYGNGGMIWEWCDVHVSAGNKAGGLNEYFIKKLTNAKSVKVKMNGRQYYDTRTLTKAQIQSIKDTYDYYIALGGTF